MKQFVRVLIKDTDNRLLVLKHSSEGSGCWNYPGGKVEEGETFEQAAIRETLEEIGVNVLILRQVTSLCLDIGNEQWEGVFYFAQVITGVPFRNEPDKLSELMFKPIDELYRSEERRV